jgi:AraC-like DNA-binding protein
MASGRISGCDATLAPALNVGVPMIFQIETAGRDARSGPRGAGPASDALRNQAAFRIVPGPVRRARDFIDANLDAPIRVADLIAVSGVSSRTLFNQFGRFLGVPPMTWLRLRRLDSARNALLRGTARSVTDAALLAGIAHLGRFSADYFRRFGELPSATLSAARQRRECAAAADAPLRQRHS